LSKLGCDAVDLGRVDGLSFWRDADGNIVEPPPVNEIDQEFFKSHKFCFDIVRMQEMLDGNTRIRTFYCGSASNQREYLHLFHRLFVLDCSGHVLRERLLARPNSFGKHASLVDHIEVSNRGYVEHMRAAGAIVIDSGRDLETVVGDVLLHVSFGEAHRLCYVLECGEGIDDWKSELRAAGHLVASTREVEPDIVDERDKVMTTPDFVTFRRAPRPGRSATVDLGKLAFLASHTGRGPIFLADDWRNRDRLMPHVDEMFVLLRRGANYRPGEMTAIQEALAHGAYAIDGSLSAAEMAGRILAVANRPGAGYVGGRRASLQA